MRTNAIRLFSNISNDHLNILVKEVKETVAADISHGTEKQVFSAADLWRIQKNRRTRVQRRAMFH